MIVQLFFTRILGLPFWWYGRGLRATAQIFLDSVRRMYKSLALDVWIKNLFIPMYGDTSFVGRSISFVIRLVMIVVRTIVLVIFSIAMLVIFIGYVFVLPFTIVSLIYYFVSLI